MARRCARTPPRSQRFHAEPDFRQAQVWQLGSDGYRKYSPPIAPYTQEVYIEYGVTKTVVISRRAAKQLALVPRQVAGKLRFWVDSVEKDDLEKVRRVPGFHDEPLKGKRKGQRSIRLSRKYRAVYIVKKASGDVEFVSVEEDSAHDY